MRSRTSSQIRSDSTSLMHRGGIPTGTALAKKKKKRRKENTRYRQHPAERTHVDHVALQVDIEVMLEVSSADLIKDLRGGLNIKKINHNM